MKKQSFKKTISKILGIVVLLLFTACNLSNKTTESSTTKKEIIYVNLASTGSNNGTSWKDSYTSLQDALKNATKKQEIWIAEGTYYPTDIDDRTVSFVLREEVDIYGGFIGNEIKLEQRNWKINETILSGNIGNKSINTDNSHHVTVGANNAIIDGFIITDGNAFDKGERNDVSKKSGTNNDEDSMEAPPIHITPEIVFDINNQGGNGAGMLCFQTTPTIRNCTFKNGRAGKAGAIYIMSANRFLSEDEIGKLWEGPKIINCKFIDNYAYGRGGAVAVDFYSAPTFIGCKFINNSCDEKGGAIYNDFGGQPNFYSCLFIGNSAAQGGALGIDGGMTSNIINCTIAYNTAKDVGAGIYMGSGGDSLPTITNSIIWGNICENDEANIFAFHQNSPDITYSCIEGGYPGLGNVDKDPKFVDPSNGNYNLSNLSPCIDSGYGFAINGYEIDAGINPRTYDDLKSPNGGLASYTDGETTLPPVDMGALESQIDSIVEPINIIRVVADGKSGYFDGSTWEKAFRSLQDAIDYAYSSGAEVWVAEGVYTPINTYNREISFTLREDVKIYGGFKGTEDSLDDRDTEKYVTILSGDIGIKDKVEDNSYHVVISSNNSLLDGFTITGGYADGIKYNDQGGAIVNYPLNTPHLNGKGSQSLTFSPVYRNCKIIGNFAIEGGGVYSYNLGKAQFIDCIFEGNSALRGGAVLDRVGASNTYENCIFKNNTAKYKGGAIFADYGALPVITNSTIEGNSAGAIGGAIYTVTRASQVENTIVTIDKTTFKDNTASNKGGAIYNFDQSIIKISNSTFKNNTAKNGGNIAVTDHFAEIIFENNSFDTNDNDSFKIIDNGILNFQ